MKKFKIEIKDNGSVEQMQNHFDSIESFAVDNRLSCSIKCNMGFVTGKITVFTKDYRSMGCILEHFSEEIMNVSTVRDY